MAGSLVSKAEGEAALCSRHAGSRARRVAGLASPTRVRPRTLSATVRSARPPARAWFSAGESATVVGVSSLVVLFEGVAVAGALAFGAWAWRSRGEATRRITALSSELAEQRSAGERREGLLRTV